MTISVSNAERVMTSSWTPGAEVTSHNGQPLREELDFFAPPPAEIGRVRTAFTTLRKSITPFSLPLRLALSLLIGIIVAAAVLGILIASRMNDHLLLISVAVGLLIAIITFPLTGFRHTCTYVGTAGIVRFRCRGSRQHVVTDQYFLFTNAAQLRTSQTRMHHNGIYTGTHYQFTWTDSSSQRVLKLTGSYHSKTDNPKEQDPFHFAASAEICWSEHRMDLARAELQQQGALVFPLSGNSFVGLAQGLLELNRKGQIERLETDAIEEVSIEENVFTVKRKGAVSGFLGIGRSGFLTLNLHQMANSRVFLLAFQELVAPTNAV